MPGAQPCPHCGNIHPPAAAVCPNTGKQLPRAGSGPRLGLLALAALALIGSCALFAAALLQFGGAAFVSQALQRATPTPSDGIVQGITPASGRSGGGTVQPPVITVPPVITIPPQEVTVAPVITVPPVPETPRGRIVFTCQIFGEMTIDQICMINADGSGWRQITNNRRMNYETPALSPDGRKVIYTGNVPGGAGVDIYETDQSGNERRLTSRNFGNAAFPTYSPDGRWIAFSVSQGNQAEIWMMGSDGSNPHVVVSLGAGQGWFSAWSPDSSQILFERGGGSGTELVIANRDGSQQREISLANIAGRGDWSPDGSSLVTFAGPRWNREIYRMSSDGSNLERLTNGGNNLSPSFSPDGGWIAFTSYRDHPQDEEGCEIYIIELSSGDIQRLTNNAYCDWQPRWGP